MVCGDKGLLGAHCAHTQQALTEDLDKPTWDALRSGNGWICEAPEAFADWKSTTEILCNAYDGGCVASINAAIKKACQGDTSCEIEYRSQMMELAYFIKAGAQLNE